MPGFSQRSPRVMFDDLPGSLPRTSAIPLGSCLEDSAALAIAILNDPAELQASLTSNFIWRDHLSLTDTFRTIHGAVRAYKALQACSTQRRRSSFYPSSNKPRAAQINPQCAWIDIDVTFETHEDLDLIGKCAGIVTLILDEAGEWRVWMLRTWLESFHAHGHPDVPNTTPPHLIPPLTPPEDGDKPAALSATLVFGAAIVGGGQAGLSVAGRLQAVGVTNVLFEANSSIGDQWISRYDSLRWHTPKEFGNLPFGRTFLPEDDEWLPRDRIGAGHRRWADKYGVNVNCSTRVDSARWDDALQMWTITTRSTRPDCEFLSPRVWQAKHLILASGGGAARAIVPSWATPSAIADSNFSGTIMHSVNYRNCASWAAKSGLSRRGIVVGTGNTAHDVAENMADAGLHTTMLQRNPTFVYPVEWLRGSMTRAYNLQKPTHEADREELTRPVKIVRDLANLHTTAKFASERSRFDALERAGFRIDTQSDLHTYLFNRFGGHHVDTGCAARIAKGEISVRQTLPEAGGAEVQQLTETGLLFKDGSELPADVIVLCTGFDHDFRQAAREIVGDEVAEMMDDYRGVDAEGEIRGYAKLSGHPNLFYFGGDARMARFYSRFIALQVQKDLLGRPLTPYLD